MLKSNFCFALGPCHPMVDDLTHPPLCHYLYHGHRMGGKSFSISEEKSIHVTLMINRHTSHHVLKETQSHAWYPLCHCPRSHWNPKVFFRWIPILLVKSTLCWFNPHIWIHLQDRSSTMEILNNMFFLEINIENQKSRFGGSSRYLC